MCCLSYPVINQVNISSSNMNVCMFLLHFCILNIVKSHLSIDRVAQVLFIVHTHTHIHTHKHLRIRLIHSSRAFKEQLIGICICKTGISNNIISLFAKSSVIRQLLKLRISTSSTSLYISLLINQSSYLACFFLETKKQYSVLRMQMVLHGFRRPCFFFLLKITYC